MRHALLGLLLLAACSRGPRPQPAEVDGVGQAMLAKARLAAIQPEKILARLALAPDAVVADVGAGPGAFTHRLAASVPRGRVIATDVREAYLRRVEADARAAGERNVETRRVLPDEPGLTDDEIDLAFLCQVDHYLRDRAAYFRALQRSLRPGGRVVIVNYAREAAAIDRLAAELGWRELDRWEPAAGMFARVYAARP